MANTFRPKQNVCELNFDDKFKYKLPIHENTLDIIQKSGKRLDGLKLTDDKESIDAAYNALMDIIDDILGDGQAELIMGMYEKPGILEAKDVVMYIVEGFTTDYEKAVAVEAPEVIQSRSGRR